MDRIKTMVVTKLFKVIDSMERPEHMIAVRRYIDLYYKMYDVQNKGLIEIYFKTRKEKFI